MMIKIGEAKQGKKIIKFWILLQFYKKLPKENNRPVSENSSNLLLSDI
jgi:hypothetical protein